MSLNQFAPLIASVMAEGERTVVTLEKRGGQLVVVQHQLEGLPAPAPQVRAAPHELLPCAARSSALLANYHES